MPDSSMGPGVIAVGAVLQAIMTTCVSLRIWSLSLAGRKFYIHDFFILMSLVFCTGLVGLTIATVVHAGLGQHASALADRPWILIDFGKLTLAIQTLYGVAMTTVRLSIIYLYLHLFSTNKRFHQACYAVVVISLLWAIGFLLTVYLNCRPLSFLWDKMNPEGRCGNLITAYLGTQVSTLVVDLLITLLPIPILWGLQMPTWRNIGIVIMFSLGLIICAISAARLGSYKLAVQYDQADFTYSGTYTFIFTLVEPLLACSLACMPLIRPVLDRIGSNPVISNLRSMIGMSKLTQSSRRTGRSNDEEALREIQTIGGGRVGWKQLSDHDLAPSRNGNRSGENSFEMGTIRRAAL